MKTNVNIAKAFKVDDEFFKDNFDTTDIEDNIYNQIAKTIARNVDVDLAKTPLVDILTGYTRYKESELKNEFLHSIIKEVREILKFHLSNPSQTKNGWHIDIWNSEDINKLNELLEILEKAGDEK